MVIEAGELSYHMKLSQTVGSDILECLFKPFFLKLPSNHV